MRFLFAMFSVFGSNSEWECVRFLQMANGLSRVAVSGWSREKRKVWDCKDWKLHADWSNKFTGQVQNGKFVSGEVFVTFAGIRASGLRSKYGGNEMQFWNITRKKQVDAVNLENSRGFATSIDYLPLEKMALFNQSRPFNTVGLYTIPELERKASFGDNLDLDTWCRASPDSKNILVFNGLELQLFDANTGKCLTRRKLEDCDHNTSVKALTFSPDGKLVAVGFRDPNRICVLSSDLESLQATFVQNSPPPFAVFSPDSRIIAIANADNGVDLISVETKKVIKALNFGREGLRCCCFSSDATLMAVCTGPKVQVVVIKTGKILANVR